MSAEESHLMRCDPLGACFFTLLLDFRAVCISKILALHSRKMRSLYGYQIAIDNLEEGDDCVCGEECRAVTLGRAIAKADSPTFRPHSSHTTASPVPCWSWAWSLIHSLSEDGFLTWQDEAFCTACKY